MSARVAPEVLLGDAVHGVDDQRNDVRPPDRSEGALHRQRLGAIRRTYATKTLDLADTMQPAVKCIADDKQAA